VAQKVLDGQDPGTIARWGGAGLLMLLLAVPATLIMLPQLPIGLSWVIGPLIVFLDLWTLITFGKAAMATAGYLRFGRVTLHQAGSRAALGGQLAAIVALPRGARGVRSVNAELICVEIGRRYDGPSTPDARELRKVRLGGLPGLLRWSSGPMAFPVRPGLLAASAAIQIPIPAHLPESDLPRAGGPVSPGRIYHAWELRVDADVPGPDLSRTFEVTVENAA
jgi:hypothetical protein